MKIDEPKCNATRELHVLLSDDEDSDTFRRVAQHVDSCHSCRHRLTELAGEQQAWSEISELLRDYTGDVPETDSLTAPGATPTEINVEFLSAPSHPEMLGRLGRYEIERVIGAGGMGIVLKGFDTELNRPVAIKVLAPHLCASGAARKRFERESRAAAAVVHEHIVAIHNVETDGTTPFIVMQFVSGESLQARVDREGPLPPREVLRIAVQAAAGLAAAHEQGVIHRDIKPANIMLENDVDRALVTDFGLARTVDDASLTHTGIIAGTPHYMSPEQANAESIDHSTDLFSLGAVLYFMATGHPPFRADRAMGVLHRICTDRHRAACEVNAEVPYELSDTIDCLLEKKPTNRPPSAETLRVQLLAQLAALQAGRHRRKRDAIARLFRRKWKSIASVAVLMTIAICIGTLAIHPSPQDFTTDSNSGSPGDKQPVITSQSFGVPAYQQIVSDPYHSIATRRVYDALGHFESSLKTHDADQIDSHWTADIQAIHQRLNHVQQDSVSP